MRCDYIFITTFPFRYSLVNTFFLQTAFALIMDSEMPFQKRKVNLKSTLHLSICRLMGENLLKCLSMFTVQSECDLFSLFWDCVSALLGFAFPFFWSLAVEYRLICNVSAFPLSLLSAHVTAMCWPIYTDLCFEDSV